MRDPARLLSALLSVARLFLFTALLTPTIFAHLGEKIVGVGEGSGEPIWYVVQENAEARDTDLSPGIYKKGADQQWNHPVVLGSILRRGDSVGLIQLTQLSAFSERAEGWGVIDGKITLFHSNASPSDTSSVAVIGSPRAPIIDASGKNNRQINLPEITSFDDVSYFIPAYSANDSSQTLMFSLRSHKPQFSDMDGITFVVPITRGSKNSAAIDIDGKILVLDYHFHNKDQLARLQRSDGFIAYNYIEPLLKIEESDHQFLQFWKNELQHNVANQQYEGLPVVAPKSNALILRTLPQITKQFTTDKLYATSFINTFDLKGKSPKVVVQNIANEKYFVGEVNMKPHQEIPASLSEVKNNMLIRHAAADWFVAYISNKMHLIYSASKGFASLVIEDRDNTKDAQVVDLGMKVHVISDDALYLFISQSFVRGALTTVYRIERLANKELSVKNKVKINEVFYASSQLDLRVYVKGGEPLFDAHTPQEMYHINYGETRSHIDIGASLEANSLRPGYRFPLNEVAVIPKVSYHTYNSNENEESCDGLYLTGVTPRKIILGKVLLPQNSSADPNKKVGLTLAETSFSHSLLRGAAVATVPVPSFQSGLKKEEFYLSFLFSENNSDPLIDTVCIKTRPSRLLEVFFHKELRVAGEVRYLVASVLHGDKDEHGEVKNCRLEHFEYKIKKNPVGGDRPYLLELSPAKSHKIDDIVDYKPGRIASTMASGLLQKKSGADGFEPVYGQQLLPTALAHIPRDGDDSVEPDPRLLFTSDIVRPEQGKISVIAYAIDRTFAQGSKEFSIVMETTDNMGRREQHVKDFAGPFSSLVGISFQAQRNYKRKVNSFGYILSLIGTKTLPPLDGLYSTFFTIDPEAKISDAISDYTGSAKFLRLSSDKNSDFSTLQNQLSVDESGNIFWTADSLSVQETGVYEVISLQDGSKKNVANTGLKLMPLALAATSDFKLFKAAGSWRVKKGEFFVVPKLPGPFAQIEKESPEEFSDIIFSDLRLQLDRMANHLAPAQHKVLVVSKEIKSYIKKSIIGSWLSKNRSDGLKWSHRNQYLDLFYFNRESVLNQKTIADNFVAMGESLAGNHKPVLIVDLAEFSGLPPLSDVGMDRPFRISLPREKKLAANPTSDDLTVVDGSSLIENVEVAPNILYTIAAEGRNPSLREFETQGDPHYSILLLGTETEWQNAVERMTLQEKSAGVEERFAKSELSDPSIEQKCNLLHELIKEKRPLFKNILFDGRNIIAQSERLDEHEVIQKVLEYFVVRTQALALEKSENTFVAIVKLLNRLRQEIRADSPMVNRGVLIINKDFIENIIGELYNLPLNLLSLPPQDPLRILADKTAPAKLYEAGYAGNFDIKMKVINGILGQTNSGDQKTIPASFVLFGKKGSGKTFLFTSLVKMLGMKYYDFNGSEEDNRDAQAFAINFGNISSTFVVKEAGDEMSGENLINHFTKFLRSSRGKRGFILFDDVHLTSSKVRESIFAKIRSMFEAKNGQYCGVPIRNITMFMTFNPTNDREKIAKVTGSSYGEPTPLQLAIATLTSEDNKVDESFFNRWGHVINLDYFSQAAKSNELTLKLRETAKSAFNFQQLFFTVSSDTVQKIVGKFPKLNARDFLSATVKTIEQMVKNSPRQTGGALYLTIPKRTATVSTSSSELVGVKVHEGEQLEAYIGDNFHIIDFERSAKGFAYFLDLVINNYRLNFYQDLINAINAEVAFTADSELQRYKLKPILYAIKAHLLSKQKHSLKEFAFDHSVFRKNLGLTSLDRLDEYLAEVADNQAPYYPEIFARTHHLNRVTSALLGDENSSTAEPSRLQMLVDYQERMQPALESYLQQLLYTKGRPELKPEWIRRWVQTLPHSDPNQNRNHATQVSALLEQFMTEFFGNQTFVENIQADTFAEASHYDVARIFCFVIDRAIARLPWEAHTSFIAKALSTLSRDLSIAASPGAQYFLFEAKRSLFSPFAIDMIFENIRSSMYGQSAWTEVEESRRASEFLKKNDRMFFDQAAVKQEEH